METPQTAVQTNRPQMGAVDFGPSAAIKPPGLDNLLDRKGAAPERPPGCWDLSGLSGSREGVKRAVQSDKLCPQADKDWLCGKIDAFPEEFNHVAVHAYCHVDKGVWVFDMTLKPSKQLM